MMQLLGDCDNHVVMDVNEVRDRPDDHDHDHDRENECFELYTDALPQMEQMVFLELARLKPSPSRYGNTQLELNAKELCPNGFVSIWRHLTEYMREYNIGQSRPWSTPPTFLDIGSALSQVVLMAQIIGGAKAYGVEDS